MRLVVGLGNPGGRYARTRHNLGFRVVHALAARGGVERWRSQFNAQVARLDGADALLALPQTFMNASGDSVAPLAGYYRVSLSDLLVVCDDVNLPFARLRMRRSGSDGGHNGLRSVIASLGSQEFPRLRIGIGRGPHDTIDQVLGVFSPDEERQLEDVIARAVDGVQEFLAEGLDAAIARVNAAGGDAADGRNGPTARDAEDGRNAATGKNAAAGGQLTTGGRSDNDEGPG